MSLQPPRFGAWFQRVAPGSWSATQRASDAREADGSGTVTQEPVARAVSTDRSGTVTQEPVARAVSTDVSGTLTAEPSRIRFRVLGADLSVDSAPRERVVRQRADLSAPRVTPSAGTHRRRSLGAVRHLWVHPPRRKRTQPCSSCVPGAPPGAECNPTLPSGDNPSLQVHRRETQKPSARTVSSRWIGHADTGTGRVGGGARHRVARIASPMRPGPA